MADNSLLHDKIGIAEGKSLSITVWPTGISLQRREKAGEEWVTKGDISIPRGTLEKFAARLVSDYLGVMAQNSRDHPESTQYKKK